MIAVISCLTWTCLIFAVVNVSKFPPSALRRSAAAAMERSCCIATGIWQWDEYRCHVLEKRKHQVADFLELEAPVVVGGRAYVETIGCGGRPGCTGCRIVTNQCFGC